MRSHAINAVLILLLMARLMGQLACAAEAGKDAAKEPAKGKAAEQAKEKGKDKEKEKDKGKDKDKSKEKDKPPACMHCGATCGLEAVCVCECGTKKKPKTEYEAKCDPICVPRCGSLPWPLNRCRHGGGCTECPSDACRAWVRQRKTLVKETKDEEVAVIERKVKYVCCRCAGGGKAGCCGWWEKVSGLFSIASE